MKLLNVQIAPFGDRSAHEGQMLVTFQERALAERLRGQSLFHGRLVRSRHGGVAGAEANPQASRGCALQADLSPENQEFARMIVEEANRVTALLDRMEGIAGVAGNCRRSISTRCSTTACGSLRQVMARI